MRGVIKISDKGNTGDVSGYIIGAGIGLALGVAFESVIFEFVIGTVVALVFNSGFFKKGS